MTDHSEVEQLVDAHGAPIFRFISRMVRDHGAAEELTQDVLLHLVRNHQRLDKSEGLRPWLYTTARNAALNHLRRRRTTRESATLTEHVVQQPSTLNVLMRQEALAEVDRAIDALAEPFRSTFILCTFEGFDYASAARVLNCSYKTVSTRMYRAWSRIRASVREEYNETM